MTHFPTMPIASLRAFVAAFALVAAGAVQAQDFERVAPKQPPASEPAARPAPPPVKAPFPASAKALGAQLKGLVFVPRADRVRPQGVKPGAPIVVEPGSVLDSVAFRALIEPFIGQPVTLDLLNEIARRTVQFYREQDRPLVDVIVPEQDISRGVIQLIAIEFVVGRIRSEGAHWFSDDVLLRGLQATPGQPVRGSFLLDDVNRLNENSFRRTELLYERGQKPGETDVILRTNDRLPLRVFGGVENNGGKTTSENRLFSGFNWGNVFGLDHRLSYQRTTSPDALANLNGRYAAHSVTYQAPLPWRDTLTLFGSYSLSRPELGQNFEQRERSAQASARYGFRLPWAGELTRTLEMGFDFKQSHGNLEFLGANASNSKTDILQFVFAGSLVRPDGWGRTSFSANLFASPGGLTPENSDAAFRPSILWAGREGASARYAYMRVGFERVIDLPAEFSWSTQITGQIASANLLPSEQLGGGGASSVRGYAERSVGGDQGVVVNNEFRLPEMRLATHFPAFMGMSAGVSDSLQLFAFFDYAHLTDRWRVASRQGEWDLASAGAGLRYNLGANVAMKLDVGQPFIKAIADQKLGPRVHFSLVVAR